MTRTPLPEGGDATLEPVRAELLRSARADARAVLAEADAEAAAVLRDAGTRVADVLAEARRQGAAEAGAVRADARVRSRRAARSRELAARRACWEDLSRQVVAGVEGLRHTDAYPAVRARLTAYVREVLGPDAEVAQAPGGGVVGEARGRRIDASLTTLALRALERVGVEAEELWAP